MQLVVSWSNTDPDYVPSACDPYWTYVLLNLQLDGTNGSTSITDSSDYAWSMSCHGNASISTAQSKFGGASAYFDGSGDAVQASCVSANNGWDFGTADFTMELFCRPSVVNVDQEVLAKRTTANNNDFWLLRITSSGAVRFYNKTGGTVTTDITSIATLTADTWYHIAVTRVSGVCKIWINGANNDSVTSNTAGSFSNAVVNVCIGAGDTTLSAPYQGYIDSVRVTKGFARYVAAFTPPTEAFAEVACTTDINIGFVSLLLHGEGANNSTSFVSAVNFNYDMGQVGTAKISTSQSKFGASSAYFDGTSACFRLPSSSQFGFGTADFTVEAWIYITGGGGTDRCITDFREPNGGTPGTFFVNTSGKLALYTGTSYGGSGTTVPTSTWVHVALSRASGTTRCFLDGVLDWSTTASIDFRASAPLGLGGGAGYGITVGSSPFVGYIDELRITKGTGRYTAGFTPPTVAFTLVGDASAANVKLLCHFEGPNNSLSAYDSSGYITPILVGGNTKVSTGQSKFGGSSIYFDGSGDYLYTAPCRDFAFGTNDFTIEAFIYMTAGSGTDRNLFDLRASSGSDIAVFFVNTSNKLAVYSGGSGVGGSGSTLSLNTWHHIAFARSGTTLRCFLDGVLDWSATYTALFEWERALYIGAGSYSGGVGSNPFTGYMDEIRITRELARYTSGFLVPTTAFPDA